MRTPPDTAIMEAVALQRLAAVRDTRPDWPSALLAPNLEPDDPPKPPAVSEDENGHAAAASD